ncbi:MAG: PGPGW domain-containing protein [Phycisphaerae bacterium]
MNQKPPRAATGAATNHPDAHNGTSAMRFARRAAVGVVGVTVILIGLALLVLPGPAFIVIPAGLAILATEFVWAKRLLRRAKQKIAQITHHKEGKSGTDHPAVNQ